MRDYHLKINKNIPTNIEGGICIFNIYTSQSQNHIKKLLSIYISYNMNDYEGMIWRFIHDMSGESLLLGVLCSDLFFPCNSMAILEY